MRIGILGGTFDPPHIGHLALAHAAIRQFGLDEVLLLPANKNPLKHRKNVTAAKDRAGMVAALIQDEPLLAYSDMELTRGGQSYTVDTLAELHIVKPAEYWFLIGADALKAFPEWKQPERLVRLARIGVAVRPPTNLEPALARLTPTVREKIDMIEMEPLGVSSTELRELLAKRKPVQPWIPESVLKYIVGHGLYKG